MRKLQVLAIAGAFALAPALASLGAQPAPAGEQPGHAVILYDGELLEFPRYASGDQYTVEIPDARRSRLVRGDVSICASKDGATVWSFPLPRGIDATLRHTPGRIEITFASAPSAAAAVPVAPAVVNLAAPAPTPAPPVAMPKDGRNARATRSILLAQSTAFESGAIGAVPQPTAGTLSDQSISLANFALDVPDSPAFAVLGLTPETVVRPSNPQELIASVLNGVDQNGNFQTGLAIDTAPYLLFFGPDVTLAQYQSSYMTRLLTRAQVSFATSKGAEAEDRAARLALGLHLTLLDRGDPRYDLDLQGTYDAIDEEVRRASGPIRPGSGMQQEAARREEQMRSRFKAAFDAARQRNWNRTNWSVGVAPSWISPSGDGDELQWNGVTVWNSFAYGFEGVPALEQSSQLIVHTRYRNHEEAPDPLNDGSFIRQDSFLAGARLRIGTVDTNVSFDGAYIREWGDGRDTSAYRVSLGLERRMTDNLWLSLSFGKEFDNEDGKNPLLILGNFKLGYGGSRTSRAAPRAPATPVVFRPSGAPRVEQREVAATIDRPDVQPDEPAASSVPAKAARPNVARKIKKLTPPSDDEAKSAESVQKVARPNVKKPIRKLTPEE